MLMFGRHVHGAARIRHAVDDKQDELVGAWGGCTVLIPRSPPPRRSRINRTVTTRRSATCGGDTPIQSLEHYWGRDRTDRRFFGVREYDFEESIVVRATCTEDSPLEVSVWSKHATRLSTACSSYT